MRVRSAARRWIARPDEHECSRAPKSRRKTQRREKKQSGDPSPNSWCDQRNTGKPKSTWTTTASELGAECAPGYIGRVDPVCPIQGGEFNPLTGCEEEEDCPGPAGQCCASCVRYCGMQDRHGDFPPEISVFINSVGCAENADCGC